MTYLCEFLGGEKNLADKNVSEVKWLSKEDMKSRYDVWNRSYSKTYLIKYFIF